MKKNIKKMRNTLISARSRWGITRKTAARILKQDVRTLAAIEQGHWSPPLCLALELEILYRVPIAFLYPKIYCKLRRNLRERELRARKGKIVVHDTTNSTTSNYSTDDPCTAARDSRALQLHRELSPSANSGSPATLW